jgi:hypothetical protein
MADGKRAAELFEGRVRQTQRAPFCLLWAAARS